MPTGRSLVFFSPGRFPPPLSLFASQVGGRAPGPPPPSSANPGFSPLGSLGSGVNAGLYASVPAESAQYFQRPPPPLASGPQLGSGALGGSAYEPEPRGANAMSWGLQPVVKQADTAPGPGASAASVSHLGIFGSNLLPPPPAGDGAGRAVGPGGNGLLWQP